MSEAATIDPVTSTIETSIASLVEAEPAESGAAIESSSPEPVADTAASQTPAADAAPPSAEVKLTPEQEEDAAIKALEAELVEKTPGLAKGKIGVSRHQAVLTRARREHEAAVKSLTEKYSKYDAVEVQERLQVAEMLESGSKEAFEFMLNHPVYKGHVEEIIQARVAAAAPKPAAVEAPTERPEPNIVLADGSLGYNAEGARALSEWHAAQVEKRLEAKFGDIDKQYGPLREERESRIRFEQQVAKYTPILENARQTLPGFKDNEPAIKQYMDANRSASLHEAYARVVVPKLQADEKAIEARIREAVKADLAKGAQATPARAVPNAKPAPAAVADDVDPTEAVIRQAIAGLS